MTTMPLDHFSLMVPQPKLEGMVAFLTSSLQHMGFKEFFRPIPSVVGMGDAAPFMWIAGVDPKDADEKTQETLLKRQHIAFTAESQSRTIFPAFPVLFRNFSFPPDL